VERLVHHFRDVVGVHHEPVVLGHGDGDAGDVRLLEGVTADGEGVHLAGDGDHGDGVHHRGREPGDEVGGARATCGEADARDAGGLRIAIRRVGRSLLVAAEDVTDRAVDERVVGGQDGPARDPEDVLYALLLQ
jgi:hypothetical protein